MNSKFSATKVVLSDVAGAIVGLSGGPVGIIGGASTNPLTNVTI